ncbi:MAG: antibiotic biosynthesis monooxygenase [Desulfobacterales bacterium]|nr:antibiotic biosynthesis monooxygenase [Desulfobacterales bacterium]
MFILISTVQAISGKEDELEKKLIEFTKTVKSEQGTMVYNLHRIKEKRGRFFFYEKFKDENSFDIHNTTNHMQELFGSIESILADTPDLIFLDEIASIRD